MKALFKFYLLACFISWVVWSPLYLPYFGIHFLPVLPYQHGLGALGPMLACFFMKASMEGKSGVKHLWMATTKANAIVWLLIAFFSPLLLLLVSLLIHFFSSGNAIQFSSIGSTPEFPQFTLLMYFIYNLIFFGFGEEVGWKGFMLPKLQQKFSALTSSILFTFFWAGWHIPLFLYRTGYTSMDFAGILGWFFSLLTGSVLLTWLFNSSRGSILVCAVFHTMIDVVFVSDVVNNKVSNYLGFLVTIWGIATIIIFGAKNLSRQQKTVYL